MNSCNECSDILKKWKGKSRQYIHIATDVYEYGAEVDVSIDGSSREIRLRCGEKRVNFNELYKKLRRKNEEL